MNEPERPAGSFGCVSFLVPVAIIGGALVGYRVQGLWGVLIGVIGGVASLGLILAGTSLILGLSRRKGRKS